MFKQDSSLSLEMTLFSILKLPLKALTMTNISPKILITGATGQVGGRVISLLQNQSDITLVAAVRSAQKAIDFTNRNIETVIFDFDDEGTHADALTGIDRLFIVTGYTVDMLRQSKALLDNAKKAGVKHVVHLGACGRDDTTIAHWAWHQLVERYIEWCGFTYTHLRPETFMQNLLSYGGTQVVNNGIIHQYVQGARKSWVDVDDVAQVAAISLLHPKLHGNQTYRLGYDAKSYYEIAALMSQIIGKPFEYQPQEPEVFLQNMVNAGAEMAYMSCVYDHYKRYAAGTIPGADDVLDNFFAITGKQPVTWDAFIQKHKEEFDY
ncbi:SDR family oxidoreductase [Mucilaginibacter terrae]